MKAQSVTLYCHVRGHNKPSFVILSIQGNRLFISYGQLVQPYPAAISFKDGCYHLHAAQVGQANDVVCNAGHLEYKVSLLDNPTINEQLREMKCQTVNA